MIGSPFNANQDLSDDEKAETVSSTQSRTSDYRRGALIKRRLTNEETEEDKLKKLKEMREKKEREEAEDSEDFLTDKSFDFDEIS